MAVSKVSRKQGINPADMKANIYDSVELLVDIHGITWLDIENMLQKLNEVLPASDYSRVDDSLTVEEINAYGDRRDYSFNMSARRRYLDMENVVRYRAKNESEIITISRLYISVYLSYEIAHNLKNNIILMDQIVRLFNDLEYFEIEKVFLVKRNSIYCSSLYKMYQCFEKSMFADPTVLFKRNGKKIDAGISKAYNSFSYEDVDVVLNKEIIAGNIEGSKDLIYEGKLDIIVSKEPLDDAIDIMKTLNNLNQVVFDMFICHITYGFASDLMAGKSEKVRRGMNYYE